MRDYVASFLEYNDASALDDKFEFVIIENSGDKLIEEHAQTLRDRGFTAKVEMTENRGFGAACNEGAALASGQLLVFVNPDIQFLTDLSPLEEFFNETRWGTIAQKRDAKSVYAFDLLPEFRNLATELVRVFRVAHRWEFLRRISYPIGSFFVVPRAEFLALEGFDERFFLYYEEAELSRRLQDRLGPPIYCNAVSILHEAFGTQSSADVRAKQYNILSKITAELTGTGRKNVVILGDFNTTDYISENQNYKRFIKFLEKNDFYDFSKNLDCTAYWWGGIEDDLWYGSILDHILATRTFLENFNRETGKTGAHCHKVNCNISTSEELGITFKEVSDHCPVTAQMDY